MLVIGLGFLVGSGLSVLSVVVGSRASTLGARLFGAVGIPLVTMLTATAGWIGAPAAPRLVWPGGDDRGWVLLVVAVLVLPALAVLRFLFTRELRRIYTRNGESPAAIGPSASG